jgi:hypothetical protein
MTFGSDTSMSHSRRTISSQSGRSWAVRRQMSTRCTPSQQRRHNRHSTSR